MVLTVIMCGCIQSPSGAPDVPVPTAGVSVVTFTDTTAHPHPVMAVNISAEKSQSSVIVRIGGGSDAGALTSLDVHINNYDGTTVDRTIPSPEVGREYSIQYFREANAANVNIVGTFSDGYKQTLLLTAV
jgi:hypothetical protein